jgi:hypothetical protein
MPPRRHPGCTAATSCNEPAHPGISFRQACIVIDILLSLATDDLHGYAIMQEVSRQSEGQYKLGRARSMTISGSWLILVWCSNLAIAQVMTIPGDATVG